jgi:hypothetical protein
MGQVRGSSREGPGIAVFTVDRLVVTGGTGVGRRSV